MIRRYRLYLISALGILALLVLTMSWISQQRYYPQVNVELPDRSRFVIIDMPWAKEQKCRDANAKLITAMSGSCVQCKMEGKCPRQIESSWKKALAGDAIDAYVVHSGTMRILVSAGNLSKQACIVMAEQIVRNKKQVARCVWGNKLH